MFPCCLCVAARPQKGTHCDCCQRWHHCPTIIFSGTESCIGTVPTVTRQSCSQLPLQIVLVAAASAGAEAPAHLERGPSRGSRKAVLFPSRTGDDKAQLCDIAPACLCHADCFGRGRRGRDCCSRAAAGTAGVRRPADGPGGTPAADGPALGQAVWRTVDCCRRPRRRSARQVSAPGVVSEEKWHSVAVDCLLGQVRKS